MRCLFKFADGREHMLDRPPEAKRRSPGLPLTIVLMEQTGPEQDDGKTPTVRRAFKLLWSEDQKPVYVEQQPLA